jgi:hypothetical protein
VLAIAPPGSDLEAILTTSGLGERFSGSEIEPMAKFIAELVNGRSVAVRAPDKYSWADIGETAHAVLRGVAAGSFSSAAELPQPPAERAMPDFNR